MLLICLLSKNIRTQIMLPYKWCNMTFNTVRLSSNSWSSDSSDSDSDSDSELCNTDRQQIKETTNNNINIRNNNNNDFSHLIDVLLKNNPSKNANVGISLKEKKGTIENYMKKAAEILTTTVGGDKEKICTLLLNNLVDGKRKDLQASISNASFDKKETMQEGKSVIKTLLKERMEINKFEENKRMVERNKYKTNRTEIVENENRQNNKPQEESKSVIQTLLKKRMEINKFEENKRMVERNKYKTNRTEIVENENRQNNKPREESKSVIQTLLKKRMEINKFEENKRRMVERNKYETNRTEIVENENRQNNKPQEESKSIIKTLQKKRLGINKFEENKTRMFNNKYSRNYESQEDQSIRNKQHESKGLRILFSKSSENFASFPILKTWEACEAQLFKFLTKSYPENAFQEMIQWTDEGKLWKFPIDNEQGMEEEHNVHFSEHIFLDRHLVGWCPTKGPIRHFMELVCNGLSKNPYMTVQEKVDHIMWYKEYFENKNDLLQKLGIGKDVSPNDKKQIAM